MPTEYTRYFADNACCLGLGSCYRPSRNGSLARFTTANPRLPNENALALLLTPQRQQFDQVLDRFNHLVQAGELSHRVDVVLTAG